jgi:hypothetical protein
VASVPLDDGSGANFKKGRRADPGALGERESLACQIGPKFKLCTRSVTITVPSNDAVANDFGRVAGVS